MEPEVNKLIIHSRLELNVCNIPRNQDNNRMLQTLNEVQ